MTSLQPLFERNQEATVYVGNCDQKVTEEILWELFVQCGPVVNVHMPRDKITGEHQGYGFCEFRTEDDADYSIKIMHMIKLFGKPIKVNKASQDKRTQEVGANLFVGNLDADVDEKMLYDTFASFGLILSTKIMRDPETGVSKGYGFVSYDNFESSDAALDAMSGQFFANKTIHVSYAYKKDTKGERHGSAAERLLAANRPTTVRSTGGTLFSSTLGDNNPTSGGMNNKSGMGMQNNFFNNQNANVPSPMGMPSQMNVGMGLGMGMGGMGMGMGMGIVRAPNSTPPGFPNFMGGLPQNLPSLPNFPATQPNLFGGMPMPMMAPPMFPMGQLPKTVPMMNMPPLPNLSNTNFMPQNK